LACVISELGAYQGAKVQKVFATDPSTICIELYRNEVCYVEISWDAERPRITYRFSRPESIPATPFVTDLRRYLIPSRLESIAQKSWGSIRTRCLSIVTRSSAPRASGYLAK
jgi:predicted ribosome quality control (RQC) complex YloA/Tae2 family protein